MSRRFQAVRGTKDILPGEIEKWQFVESVTRELCECFGFSEIRTPVLETTDLFVRSSGAGTDLVSKEMYSFFDKGKNAVTMKPELTAPVVRAVIQHNLSALKGLTKLYYIMPGFRQERPQAGRFRQFHQIGVEAIGSPNAEIDAEIIALASMLYLSFGVDHSIILNSIGAPCCRPSYIQKLATMLNQQQSEICETCQIRIEKNPLRALDCKNESCQQIYRQKAPKITEHLCNKCSEHFEEVKNHLDNLGIEYEVDPFLVRGLDYYTRTAFEFRNKAIGSQDALCGGGRYDLLVEDLGGKPTPAIGFAAGIERLLLAMNDVKIDSPAVDLYFVVLGEKARNIILPVVMTLRANGFRVEMDYLRRSMRSQMREANKLDVQFVAIFGDDELEGKLVSLKDMQTGDQSKIHLNEFVEKFVHLHQ